MPMDLGRILETDVHVTGRQIKVTYLIDVCGTETVVIMYPNDRMTLYKLPRITENTVCTVYAPKDGQPDVLRPICKARVHDLCF